MRRSNWVRIVGAGALALAAPLTSALSASVEPAGKAQGGASAAADLYAADPAPMAVTECGRCHPGQFGNLREAGGAHRFDCRDCHEVFHAYNPRKNNYAELMPECAKCHSMPHGPQQTECLSCHENPHAPKRAPALTKLTGKCAQCHPKPAEQLRDFPSAHTKQGCEACHSQRHGRVPVCSECHKPHFQGQAEKGCRGCHPVHRPKEISLALDADARTCGACHGKVFSIWTDTKSKHGTVNCSVCHTKHGVKPACTDCHRPPHDPKMLAKFKGCLSCHLDAHNLPVK